MADPVTIATIGIGATAAGGGVGALGSILGGQSQGAMYDYQANLARMNVEVAKQNAAWATQSGEVEAQQSGMQTRFQIGQTKAIQGASGLNVNTGSAVDVRASEAEIGSENQALIRSNAAHAAYGFQVEGANQQAQATMYQMAGSQSRTAGVLGAFSSILGGVGNVSSKWLQAKSTGTF